MDGNAPRKKGFQKGHSGNAAGRPRGVQSKASKMREAISANIPAILELLTTQALSGDVAASKLLLERCIAPLKPVETPSPIQLSDGTLTSQARSILAAMSIGDISSTQATQLIEAISKLGKLIEIDELSTRITLLESKS